MFIKKNILLTGLPGVGKTTIIKRLIKEFGNLKAVGFFTSEIRENGIRKGFAIESLDGEKGILSHISFKSPFQVGKYKVAVNEFEIFLEAITFLNDKVDIIIIDEIGKMECLSQKFRKLIVDIFNSDKILIATIAKKGDNFINSLKSREDVNIFDITINNRDIITNEIKNFIKVTKGEMK